ncbi:MAG: DUF962 domain-containing protein [Acetobacteraceae bacterium]|nr:DUF962 domain-containing protein [Acetobacteraceae bacterium]
MTATPSRFASFESFWPYYLSENARPATRAVHVAGTWTGIMVLLWALVVGPLWLVLLAPVTGCAFAGISHMAIERNRPASFTYPLWSLRGDMRMAWLAATFRLGAELRRHDLIRG